MKNITKKIALSAVFIFGLAIIGLAQGGAPPPPPSSPPGVPIDGGLSLLAAAGIGYGANKYRNHKKNKRSTGLDQ